MTKEETERLEEQEKEKELFWKKVKYYFQEFFILFMTFVGVLISDAMSQRSKGNIATLNDIYYDWLNLLLSAAGALICYGTLFTKFKYNDSTKPPLIKRGVTALALGIAWRTGIGWAQG